jgi:pyruvate,water dikinase
VTLEQKGGTRKSSAANHQEACITPVQVLELTRLLEQVEAYYQKPVDIEWAISEGKLFLLQARPITTYLPLPEEMITPPGAPKQLYANATLIEQGLEKPLTVLGTDFLGYVLREMTGIIGSNVIGLDGIAFTKGGRYYLHLSNSIKMMGLKSPLAPGSMGDTSVTEILANLDIKQYTRNTLPAKLIKARLFMLFRILPMMPRLLGIYRDPEAYIQKYQEAYPGQMQRLEDILKQELSFRELAVELNTIVHFFSVENGPSMFMIPQFVELRLKQIFKNPSASIKDALISLGISLPGINQQRWGN